MFFAFPSFIPNYAIGIVMSVKSSIKQTPSRVRHSYSYGEWAKVPKPSVFQRFGLVIDFLLHNLGEVFTSLIFCIKMPSCSSDNICITSNWIKGGTSLGTIISFQHNTYPNPFNPDSAIGIVMSVKSSINYTLLQRRHSHSYGEWAKVLRPSALQRFGLVIDFLLRNWG